MAELVAVFGDENDHNDGALTCDNNPGKVFISGKLVAIVDSSAQKDALDHNNPKASSGSGKVFALGKAIHRHNDSRNCGAHTVVSNQSKVTCG